MNRQRLYDLTGALVVGLALGLGVLIEPLWLLAIVGLVLLLRISTNDKKLKANFAVGLITMTAYTFCLLFPLASAGTWTGWMDFTDVDIDQFRLIRGIVIYVILSVLSLFGGLLGAIFLTGSTWVYRRMGILAWLIAVPILWCSLLEVTRDAAAWGYNWVPLSFLLLQSQKLSLLIAFGGSKLATIIIVLFCALLVLLSKTQSSRKRLGVLTGIVGVLIAALALAEFADQTRASSETQNLTTLKVAVVQLDSGPMTKADLTPFAMNKHYFSIVEELLSPGKDELDLIVLPESISFGSVSLDGLKSKKLSEKTLSRIDTWSSAFSNILPTRNTLLVLGADTVEKAKDYNSTLVFSKSGVSYRYHKQNLVPFAEAQVPLFTKLGFSGDSTYSAGQAIGVMKTNRLNIGFFICQEGLYPQITDALVRDGAQLLISTGNDGVFTNPMVASINHRAARMRALESGRTIVRGMKSGVSSVILPTGQEQSLIPVGENGVLVAQVSVPINQN